MGLKVLILHTFERGCLVLFFIHRVFVPFEFSKCNTMFIFATDKINKMTLQLAAQPSTSHLGFCQETELNICQ